MLQKFKDKKFQAIPIIDTKLWFQGWCAHQVLQVGQLLLGSIGVGLVTFQLCETQGNLFELQFFI